MLGGTYAVPSSSSPPPPVVVAVVRRRRRPPPPSAAAVVVRRVVNVDVSGSVGSMLASSRRKSYAHSRELSSAVC